MGRQKITFAILQWQSVTASVSRLIFFVLRKTPDKRFWIVGPDEIAGLTGEIGRYLQDSKIIILGRNNKFQNEFSFVLLETKWRSLNHLLRLIVGPILFGWILANAKGIIYVGDNGFLTTSFDNRAKEMEIAKDAGLIICCYLTGSDIRSIKLATLNEEKYGLELYPSYFRLVSNFFFTNNYELVKKSFAEAIDKHSDITFNAPFDQASYLVTKVYFFRYFIREARYSNLEDKFNSIDRIKILHAPSNPLIKGTQIIRADVKRLQSEGYPVDYVELLGVSNEHVFQQLITSHIVINELYSMMPGVFAVEAMAAKCAVFTSADQQFETLLPGESNNAWVVVRPGNLYENLKYYLDNPAEIIIKARLGYEWASSYARATTNAAYLLNQLNEKYKDYKSRPTN